MQTCRLIVSISLAYCRDLTAYVGIHIYNTIEPVLSSDAVYLRKYPR
jgi:hypothetical protein